MAAAKILEKLASGGGLSSPLLREAQVFITLTPNDKPKGSPLVRTINMQDIESMRKSLLQVVSQEKCVNDDDVEIRQVFCYQPRRPPILLEDTPDCCRASILKPLKLGVRYGELVA